MDDIDALEYGGRPFVYTHNGETIETPDPRTLHYQRLLLALRVRHVPGTPDDLPDWKCDLVFARWQAAWELPSFENGRRLAYLIDHYRGAIVYDLMTYAQADLGDLWRERRWLLLLHLLDRLPTYSQFASAVAMDEDHAKMVAEAIQAQREREGADAKPAGPALTTWTPELAMLTNLLDAVRGVQHAVVAVNSSKGKTPEPPKPSPRPRTPLEDILRTLEYQRRKAAHESLVARVLRKKRPPEAPVH